jgi:tetratricopeptide (TPR) repeat protein
MSLATAQASAMDRMGKRIDNRLVQIDESILNQNQHLSEISGAIDSLNKDLRTGFIEIADRISVIDDTLIRMEQAINQIDRNVSHPEETRAFERFRRAVRLLEKGHGAEALDHINHAILNGDGPTFRHIPQFNMLRGQILMGGFAPMDKSVINYDEASAAFWQASIHLDGEDKAIALCRSGAAAYLNLDFEKAEEIYLEALQIPHAVQFTYFELAKCAVHLGKERDLEHHILHAVDRDWKMIAFVARDETLLRRADDIEALLQDYRGKIVSRLGNRKALAHVVTGPTERNLVKIWNTLNSAVRTAKLADIDADLAAAAAPMFRMPSGTFGNLAQDWLGLFDLVGKGDVGLLDLNRACFDPSFIRISQTRVKDATNHLRRLGNIMTCLRYRECHKSSAFSNGIEFTAEAVDRAQSIEIYEKNKKPGLLGRFSKRPLGRAQTELHEVWKKEVARLSGEVFDTVVPVASVIVERCVRTEEIVKEAEHCLARLKDLNQGRIQLLKPCHYMSRRGGGGYIPPYI